LRRFPSVGRFYRIAAHVKMQNLVALPAGVSADAGQPAANGTRPDAAFPHERTTWMRDVLPGRFMLENLFIP